MAPGGDSGYIGLEVVLEDKTSKGVKSVTKNVSNMTRELLQQKTLLDQLSKSVQSTFKNMFSQFGNFKTSNPFSSFGKDINTMTTASKKAFRSFKDGYDMVAERDSLSKNRDLNAQSGIVSRLQQKGKEVTMNAKRLGVPVEFLKGIDNKEQLKAFEEWDGKRQMEKMFPPLPKNNGLKSIEKVMDDLNPKVDKSEKKFAGWAMSLMFAGMAIKRIFDTIWKSSTKTFNDVMHSTEGTVTEFDRLQSSISYMGFAAGEALAPIAALLLPIVWAIGDWIKGNEDLFGDIVVALGVGGTVLLALGSGKLAWDGWSTAMGKIPSDFKGIKNLDWAGLKTTMQKSVGVVAIGASIYMMKNAIQDFKDGKYMESALGAAGAIFTSIGGMRMIAGKGGMGLIVIGASLELVSQGAFFKTLFSVLGIAGAFIASAFAMFGARFEWEMEQSFKRTFKEKLIEIITNALTGPLGMLIELITGADLGGFVNDAFSSGSKQETFDFDFMHDFQTRYAEMVMWGDTMDTNLAAFMDSMNTATTNFNETGDVDQSLLISGTNGNLNADGTDMSGPNPLQPLDIILQIDKDVLASYVVDPVANSIMNSTSTNTN